MSLSRGTRSGSRACHAGKVSADITPPKSPRSRYPEHGRDRVGAGKASLVVEDSERRCLKHQHRLGDDEQHPLVDPVGERTGRKREEQDGDTGNEVHDREVDGGLSEAEDHQCERRGLHPRTGVGYERSEPEQGEVARTERLEGATSAHHRPSRSLDVCFLQGDLIGTGPEVRCRSLPVASAGPTESGGRGAAEGIPGPDPFVVAGLRQSTLCSPSLDRPAARG